MEFHVDDVSIGDGHRAFIIAELSANHNQDYTTALKTLHAMKDAGADAIKLQTYKPETMTLDGPQDHFKVSGGTPWDGEKLYALYDKAQTPWEWHAKLQKEAKKLGMVFFSSPFDNSAVDFLETLHVPLYKIASFEITDIPLVRYVAAKGKPIIASTGIATLEDIQLFIDTCKAQGNEKILLLKCTSAYPTPLEESNLCTIPDMRVRFKTLVGLSDHTIGDIAPVTAVALGAKVIEKHFILDRSLGGPDAEFSMEPQEFKQMVERVRMAEASLGVPTYSLSTKNAGMRRYSRSLYAGKDVKKGELFSAANVRCVRPAEGLEPKYYDQVIGKAATQDISFGTPLQRKHVKGL